MAFATRDDFLALIEDRGRFIERIFDLYPQLFEDWKKEQITLFQQEAKNYAQGDKEVEMSIFSSLSASIDDTLDFSNLFYQALLLLSYAHYESTITALATELVIKLPHKTLVNSICKFKNHTLSQKSKQALEFIENTLKPLRNNICHNNSGTLRNQDKIKGIASRTNSISLNNIFDKETISITSPELIEEALKHIHILLKELCDITGHRVKYLK